MDSEGAKTPHINPITRVIDDVVSIFVDMGFEVAQGPEIESEHYNFDVLNVPKEHPARDMQDTFWLKQSSYHGLFARPDSQESGVGIKGVPETVLRTQTSAVQGRYMETHEPPFAIVVPGKVFRREATDATHEMQFFQIEGLAVGEDVTLAHLKGTLLHFLEKLFGDDIAIHLRPGYFPFVEPGVEIDMRCFRCHGSGLSPAKQDRPDTKGALGCASCKGSGWIEILGAGMVHPNVLSHAGINPKKYNGFAFGVGVDRLVMLKYGIPDVRMLYAGDLRVINQF